MSSKPKRDVPMLSEAEEAALQAQIANDPDAAEATDEQLAQMRPAREAMPPALFKALTKRGRPKAESPKELLTLRVDPAVIEAYKSAGPGWQSRMHDALVKGSTRVYGTKAEAVAGIVKHGRSSASEQYVTSKTGSARRDPKKTA